MVARPSGTGANNAWQDDPTGTAAGYSRPVGEMCITCADISSRSLGPRYFQWRLFFSHIPTRSEFLTSARNDHFIRGLDRGASQNGRSRRMGAYRESTSKAAILKLNEDGFQVNWSEVTCRNFWTSIV